MSFRNINTKNDTSPFVPLCVIIVYVLHFSSVIVLFRITKVNVPFYAYSGSYLLITLMLMLFLLKYHKSVIGSLMLIVLFSLFHVVSIHVFNLKCTVTIPRQYGTRALPMTSGVTHETITSSHFEHFASDILHSNYDWLNELNGEDWEAHQCYYQIIYKRLGVLFFDNEINILYYYNAKSKSIQGLRVSTERGVIGPFSYLITDVRYLPVNQKDTRGQSKGIYDNSDGIQIIVNYTFMTPTDSCQMCVVWNISSDSGNITKVYESENISGMLRDFKRSSFLKHEKLERANYIIKSHDKE